MTTALLVAEHLGAPKALRDVTALLHAGTIGFGDATHRVVACLEGDEEVLAAVEAVVGHGAALLGRLEALKESPARALFLGVFYLCVYIIGRAWLSAWIFFSVFEV